MDKDHPDYKVKRPRPVWERGDLDTDQSWPYFKAWRDITSGVRSIQRIQYNPASVRQDSLPREYRPVDRTNAPTLADLRRWHEEGHWAERTAAWDAHLDALQCEEREALGRQHGAALAAEDLKVLQKMHDTSAVEAQKLLAAAESTDLSLLKPAELIKMVEAGVKLRQLLKGKPTEITEDRVEDLSAWSDEDLAALAALRSKCRT